MRTTIVVIGYVIFVLLLGLVMVKMAPKEQNGIFHDDEF